MAINSSITKSLIKMYKEDLERNDFTSFYNNLYKHRMSSNSNINGNHLGAVTDVFIELGLLPEILHSLEEIPPRMFMGSNLVDEITIPSNIKRLGPECFESNLIKKISFEDGCTYIGSESFYCCVNLVEIKLPNTLFEIAKKAFFSCINLKELTLPPMMNFIGENCFDGCSLQTINVSSTLKGDFEDHDFLRYIGLPKWSGKINYY